MESAPHHQNSLLYSSLLDSLIDSAISEFERESQKAIKTVSTPQSVFDVFVQKCLAHHAQPAHTLAEIRQTQSKKAKGDLFEQFCLLYLLRIKEYDRVWLLKDLPDDVKTELRLPQNRADYGIDIVCKKNDAYSAVQCKFKAPTKPRKISFRKADGSSGAKTVYPCVGWREICTFCELCNASGPWAERIVCTTAPYVRRLGGIKKSSDKSICCGTFRAMSIDAWKRLRESDASSTSSSTSFSSSTSTSFPSSSSATSSSTSSSAAVEAARREELRAKRQIFLDRLSLTSASAPSAINVAEKEGEKEGENAAKRRRQ